MAGAATEYITYALLLFMLAGTILSFFPAPSEGPFRPIFLFSPLLVISDYVAYEFFIPVEVNIRIDLLIIWPMIALAILARLFHVYREIRAKKR